MQGDSDCKRILFIYSAASYGGLVRNLSHIANHLDTSQYHATFLALRTPGDTGSMRDVVPRHGIELESLSDTAKVDSKALASIAKRIRENEFDLISSHGHKADLYAVILKYFYRSRLPMITIAHGWVVPGVKMKVYDFIDKFCMRFFDRVILLHQRQRQELPFLSDKDVTIVPNAIPALDLPDDQVRFQKRLALGIDSQELVVGFCGRLSREKRVDILIRAFARLPQTGVVLIICGEGPQMGNLQTLAKQLAVEDKVRFLGFVKNVNSVLSALDVYCSCSAKEGLPNNVLEAQLFALPSVLSDIDAHKEIIGDSSSAILIDGCDVEQIASEISRLFDSTIERKNLGDKARENVMSRFSIEQRLESLQSVYSELLS